MNSQFSGGNYSNFGGSGPQFRTLILVIKVSHLLFNLSLLKIKVNLVGLFVRYVERMVIQLLIVTIAWTLHIKEGMLLLNLPQ